MKPLIKSVLEVSETHLVSRISSVFLRLIVFRKFPKKHIWATCVYTTEFRDTALIRASDISRGRGPAKFPKKREIPRNPPEIFPNTYRQNIFNTYLGY